MKKARIYFICVLAIITVTAFQSDDKKPEAETKDSVHSKKADLVSSSLMQTALKERLEAYKKKAMKTCSERILSEAETYVDSIISVQLNPPLIDTTQAPPKPERPTRPYDTLILDSIKIDPLIMDSLLIDSIH